MNGQLIKKISQNIYVHVAKFSNIGESLTKLNRTEMNPPIITEDISRHFSIINKTVEEIQKDVEDLNSTLAVQTQPHCHCKKAN